MTNSDLRLFPFDPSGGKKQSVRTGPCLAWEFSKTNAYDFSLDGGPHLTEDWLRQPGLAWFKEIVLFAPDVLREQAAQPLQQRRGGSAPQLGYSRFGFRMLRD